MKCLVLLALAIGTLAQDAVEDAPITRVVKMLETLKKDINRDYVAETMLYRKFACWCVDTSKKIGNDIHKARQNMNEQQTEILELRSLIEMRSQEIAALEEEIAANLKAQEEATALRQKERKEFEASSAETQQALAALTKAIDVLKAGVEKAGASFLQASASRSEVAKVIKTMPLTASIDPKHLSLLSEFLKADSKYAPQSMTVQGILKDMFATFARNLMKDDQSEASANKDFEKFIALKQESLDTARRDKADKEKERAEAEEQEADTQQAYDDTKEQMDVDIKFFDETVDSCTAKKDEWVQRATDRENERDGVQKALDILTDPANRDLFSKSIKPGTETIQDSNVRDGAQADAGVLFLQTGSATGAAVKAYDVLKALARKTHSVRYASLAALTRSAKSGHFDIVIKAIDDVLAELSREEADDIAKRDECKDEYTALTSKQNDLKWKIKNDDAFIAKMIAIKEELKASEAAAEEDKQETQWSMGNMTENRENENQDFKDAKKDDEDTIALLISARDALEKFFKKEGKLSDEVQTAVKGNLLQKEPVFEVSDRQAPDATFSHKSSRKGQSKDAVSLLTMIIQDSQDEIKQGIANENKSQYQYQKAFKAAEQKVDDLNAEILRLQKEHAKRSLDQTDREETKRLNNEDLTTQNDRFAEIKPDCDWMLNSFHGRAAARKAELEGLTAAKEYLAGASTGLIQKSEDKFDQIGFVSLH